MTYDYADWDDERYGEGETSVTLSLEGGAELDCVTFVTRALGGDVKLHFTLAPDDTLDLLARVVRYTEVDVNQVIRAVIDAVQQRDVPPADDDAGDPDHERDLVLDRDLL